VEKNPKGKEHMCNLRPNKGGGLELEKQEGRWGNKIKEI